MVALLLHSRPLLARHPQLLREQQLRSQLAPLRMPCVMPPLTFADHVQEDLREHDGTAVEVIPISDP